MAKIRELRAIYVGGKWIGSNGESFIDVRNPATEAVIARVPEGTYDDVNSAVDAAQSALAGWTESTAADRANWLRRLRQGLLDHLDELTEILIADVGMPSRVCRAGQIQTSIFNLENFARLLDSSPFKNERIDNSLVVWEPVGVVACITPWNFPLHQVMLKVGAALAAGCTVVVKPREVAPLSIYKLAEIVDEVGLPPGVFNIVSGSGSVVGEALVTHPGVDMVSFTGSTRAGKRIAELAASTVKKVALELGGKGANVVLEDADLERAVREGLASCYWNSGQTCGALTRFLVPSDRLAEVEELAIRGAASYVIGDPTSEETVLGPLVSAVQLDRVRGYIRSGMEEGARLLIGGPTSELASGYFVPPTVFSRVTPAMKIAQEEIFGPVLSIITHEGEDDAIRIANATPYGLHNGVWSGDPDRAMRVARRLRSGQVTVNGGAYNPGAPFGGYKQSGLGREAGTFGIEEFLEVKAIQR